MELRKKEGNGQVAHVVPKGKDAPQETVFTLKLTGGQPKLAEPAKKSIAEVALLALAEKRKSIADTKGPPCDIESSLAQRTAAGAINAIVKEAK